MSEIKQELMKQKIISLNKIHPGIFLGKCIINSGMTFSEFARSVSYGEILLLKYILGVRPFDVQFISRICEIKGFGEQEYWVSLQKKYDTIDLISPEQLLQEISLISE